MIQRDDGHGGYYSFDETTPLAPEPALEVPDDHVADKPTPCEISLREAHALLAMANLTKTRIAVIQRNVSMGRMMEREAADQLEQLNLALRTVNRIARATLEGVGISAPC